MPNLEQRLIEWRQQMLAAGIKNPAPLDELENHLREEIERQLKSGQSETEAFASAIQKIGPAQLVQSEFAKVEKHRANLAGQKSFGIILGALQLIVIAAVLSNSSMTLDQRISSLVALALSLLLVLPSRQFFSALRARQIRPSVLIILGIVPGTVWLGIFAYFFVRGHEFPFGQYLTNLLWTNCPPLAVYLGLIMEFQIAKRRKTALSNG